MISCLKLLLSKLFGSERPPWSGIFSSQLMITVSQGLYIQQPCFKPPVKHLPFIGLCSRHQRDAQKSQGPFLFRRLNLGWRGMIFRKYKYIKRVPYYKIRIPRALKTFGAYSSLCMSWKKKVKQSLIFISFKLTC